MFQHVKTDHRVETASGETVEIAVNAQALLKSEAGGTILHKRTILRIEVHKPDMLDTLQACCGKSMGADATAEIKHIVLSTNTANHSNTEMRLLDLPGNGANVALLTMSPTQLTLSMLSKRKAKGNASTIASHTS